jgi:hypothetical protein
MKKINELTEQEILDLTEEQIEKMIKISCAEEGVKMLKKPEKPAYHAIPPADVLPYRVSGVSPLFPNIKDAEEIARIIQKSDAKDYGYEHDQRVIRDHTVNFSTEPFPVYSLDLHKEILPLIKENERLNQSYEAAFSEYTAEKQKRDELSGCILNRIGEVRGEYAEMERIWTLYRDEYLPLSGDETVAMAFLKKAYTVNSKTERYIEDNMKNTKETEATV